MSEKKKELELEYAKLKNKLALETQVIKRLLSYVQVTKEEVDSLGEQMQKIQTEYKELVDKEKEGKNEDKKERKSRKNKQTKNSKR